MDHAFTPTVAVLLVFLGLAVGTFGTLVGVGGGFLLAPILLIVYPSESAQTITTISLAVVLVNAAAGSFAYARQRRIDYRSGVTFAIAGIPGAILGVFLVGIVPRRPFDAIFATVLASVGAWLLLRPRAAHPHPLHSDSGSPRELIDSRGRRYVYRVRIAQGAVAGVLIGFVSSFLGIGGGILQVPLMIGALGFPAAIATATSQLVLAILALVGTTAHTLGGDFSPGHGLRRTAALSVGVLVGAQLGARLSLHIAAATIQRLLGFAVIAVALRLAVAAAV